MEEKYKKIDMDKIEIYARNYNIFRFMYMTGECNFFEAEDRVKNRQEIDTEEELSEEQINEMKQNYKSRTHNQILRNVTMIDVSKEDLNLFIQWAKKYSEPENYLDLINGKFDYDFNNIIKILINGYIDDMNIVKEDHSIHNIRHKWNNIPHLVSEDLWNNND